MDKKDNPNINWFPGHMKKTKDMIVENLKLVDVVIEILDARIPLSSKNPDISKLAINKKKILVLNKVDLVDGAKLAEWKKYFLDNNMANNIIILSVEKGTNFNELRTVIDKMYLDKLEIMKKKGLRKTQIRAMIVGIPNVGKSKFINRFTLKNKARVGNTPGFTRGKQWIRVSDKFELLDTPGVLWPKFEDTRVAYNLAITGSIKDNVLPLEKVANALINKMKDEKLNNINSLIDVYRLDESDLSTKDNNDIFNILENRLGIFKNEEYNYEQISRRLLKDYREGKLGRFFLERPF